MRVLGTAALLLCVGMPVLANDTTAQLSTGGLLFVANDNIEMLSEHLSISESEIEVVYEFNNKLDTPQTLLVAFPMPDVENGPESMIDVPITYAGNIGMDASDPDNLFGFTTSFNGQKVSATLHQYAVHNNIDYTKLLAKYGLAPNPLGEDVYARLNELPAEAAAALKHNGLIFGMEYDAGAGWQSDYMPLWTLRSTYSWEAVFPPGKSEVIHRYRPSVGGTVGVSFIPPADDDGYFARRLDDYRHKYCLEDDFIAAVKASAMEKDGWTAYPYTESWISYVWSTGNNWAGPIGSFTLTIDKGSSDALVSFCGENVTKTGPTTFEMTATNWFPPWDRELDILLLRKVDWFD